MNRQFRARKLWGFALAGLLVLTCATACRRNTTTGANPGSDTPAIENLPDSDLPAQTGILLFRDDFQDGQPQEWSINSAWNVEQYGEIYLFAASDLGGAWVTEGGGWSDYLYQSAFRVNSGVMLISINLSQAGRYGLRLGADGVYLFKEQPAGTVTILSEAGPTTAGDWHRVSFASQGGHVQVYIDQVLWFDVTDPNPLGAGTIAVSALTGARVGVDNVLVTKIQGTLVAGVPEAPAPLDTTPIEPEEVVNEADSLPVEDVEVVTVEEPEALPPAANGLPDLVVSDLTITPDPIIQGQAFNASFLITNQGDGISGAFTFRLHFHAAAAIADCNMDVASLAPGEVAWGGCTRTISGDTGTYPIEITADVENEIAESNEENNFTVLEISVQSLQAQGEPDQRPPSRLPDLVVTSIALHEDSPINGVVYYLCSVSNIGDADTGQAVRYQFLVNGLLTYDVSGSGIVAGSSSGGAGPVTNDPPFELTCVVDGDNAIAESNEDNNSLTVTIP